MFDCGDCALRNVRIDRYLRRRRNDNGSRDAGDGGNVGDHGDVWDVNIVRNVDNLGDAGNVGIVGNVRFRLEQHCFIVGANVDVARNAGQRCSNGDSVGIYRNRQSWGQLRSSGTDDKRIAHCGDSTVGANDANRYISACCFICDNKHCWQHSSRE
jgi:hypothetical protein